MIEKTEENQASSEGESMPDGNGVDASSEVEQLQSKLSESESKYKYLYADFENFKKRVARERMDLLKYGWEPIARDLIGVIDNMERALEHVNPETDQNLVQGLKMILKQFHDTLERQGVRIIDAGANSQFNPELHEAVGQVESEQPEGAVAGQQLKGYTLHGRLLRPAKVLISKGLTNGRSNPTSI